MEFFVVFSNYEAVSVASSSLSQELYFIHELFEVSNCVKYLQVCNSLKCKVEFIGLYTEARNFKAFQKASRNSRNECVVSFCARESATTSVNN